MLVTREDEHSGGALNVDMLQDDTFLSSPASHLFLGRYHLEILKFCQELFNTLKNIQDIVLNYSVTSI